MWFIIALIVQVLVTALEYALQPKAAKIGPGDVQAPIADLAHAIPYVAGTAPVRGPNCVWYGTVDIHDEGKGLYSYRLNMQLVICHGGNWPAKLLSVWVSNLIPVPSVILAENGVRNVRWANCKELTRGKYNYSSGPDYEGQIAFVHTCTYTKWDGAEAIDHTEHGYMVVAGPGSDTNVNSGSWRRISDWDYIANSAVSRTDGAIFIFNGYDWVADTSGTSQPNGQVLLTLDYEQPNHGGVHGTVAFYPGLIDQGADELLTLDQRGGDDAPPYSGLAYVVFRDRESKKGARINYPFFWGNSPSIPNVAFEIQRIPDPLGLAAYGAAAVAPPKASFLHFGGFQNSPPASPSGYYIVNAGHATGLWVGHDDAVAYYNGGVWNFQTPTVGAFALDSTTGLIYKYTGVTQPGGRKWVETIETGYDANVANVVYDLLTDDTYGLGISTAKIDAASFIAAGRTLAAEGLGISIVLDSQKTFDEVVQDLIKSVDFVLYTDPSSGLWTMKLNRQDYDPSTLLSITPDDYIEAPEYERTTWMDVANSVTVQYCDRLAGYSQRVVTVKNASNRIRQHETVSVQNTYNPITTSGAATLCAQRDLAVLSQSLAKVTLKTTRKAWKLRPGSVFKLTDPEIGVSNMPMRVLKIGYGTIEDRKITIQCTEDVFGTPITTYVPPATNWEDPAKTDPFSPSAVTLWEPPYPLLADLGPGAQRAVMALAARGASSTTSMGIYTADDGATFTDTGLILDTAGGGYTPTALLSGALSIEERTSTVTVQGATDFDTALAATGDASRFSNLLVVDDEVMQFGQIIDNGDGTWALTGVKRGALDTIPAAHTIGTRIWWIRAMNTATGGNMPVDTAVTVAVTGKNRNGETFAYNEVQHTLTTATRESRPFVPGKWRAGSATDLPSSLTDQVVIGSFPISWADRNRISQARVIAQDEAEIAPESGQTSRVRLDLRTNDLFVLRDQDGAVYTTAYVDVCPLASIATAHWGSTDATLFWETVGIYQYPVTSHAIPSAIQSAIAAWGSSDSPDDQWEILLAVDFPNQAFQMGSILQYFTLYQVALRIHSGKLQAALRTDWRPNIYGASPGTPDPTYLTAAGITAASRTVTPADFTSAPSGLAPTQVRLDSQRDGFDSWEERDSGHLFVGGWGMNWGMLWGGN